MEQMQAIWSALDEMLDQDPKKYEDFIKSQVEAGRSAFEPGNCSSSNICRKSDFASILSSLAQRNQETKKKENESSVGKGDQCEAKALKTEEVIKKKNLDNYEKLDVKVGGDVIDEENEKESFELRLPASILPTKIKTTGKKGCLIQEISSTEVTNDNNWENESKTSELNVNN